MKIIKIFSNNSSDNILLWKPHLASDFEDEPVLKRNGVGKGGHLFKDFNEMVKRIGKTLYWVVPVLMTKEEFNDLGNGIVEAKVTKFGLGNFAPVSYWEKNQPQNKEI